MLCLMLSAGLLPSNALAIDNPKPFNVTVTGDGPAMLLIPGLASSGKVWDETVAYYKKQYTCHVITLAGFGGEPPIEEEAYLNTVRDALLDYISDEKLDQPIVVGHSLGGFLALWMAATVPDAVGPLVIVDSLPFLSGARDPAATVEDVRSQAEQMRTMSASLSQEQFRQQQAMILPSMITDSAHVEVALATGGNSHPPTVAQAMYELMTTDLRDDLAAINVPVLVMGTWVFYQQYGATREQTLGIFQQQYAQLNGVDIQLNDKARHFIMYDDLDGMVSAMDTFLNK